MQTANANKSELVIETKGLSRVYKTYKKKEGILESIKGFWDRQYEEKVALAPTDLQIAGGQIVGLVGANGAGKTTLLKMLSGLIHPSSGTAQVLGYTPWERKHDYLRQMSILLGQKNQLWWDISPMDSYLLLADIYDIDKATAIKRIHHLAEILKAEHVLQTQLRRLSLGERMKMEIIGALLHEPKVLFLDEPTIGLDIVAQTSIRQFLAEYAKEKKPTIILTSHYMDDIAKLSDRLLLISKGKMVYDGTVKDFTKKSRTYQKISFSLSEPLDKDLHIASQNLTKGTQEISIQISNEELQIALTQITQISGVQNLKIEEADFEDSIHAFLEAQ
ncbi:MAG: ABC transporter ATP-binding protein [Oligoflexia bacterium]|nr:MAG: ABC transporter ATP-binding protein [Oligoflexia bacterium]